jgi:hypothetical protein
MMKLAASLCLVLFVACGGGQKSDSTTPGETHETTSDDGAGGDATGEPAVPDAGLPDAGPPPSPVTLVFTNAGATDLTFSLDKGWGGTVFAYSGKPPKAKPALLFPKYCTGPCDAATAEEACPLCKEGETPKERQAAERAETSRQIVTPGGSFELPWDGQVLVYEKASKEQKAAAKHKKCECWKRSAPEAGEYTVRACAMRTASKLNEISKTECVEGVLQLPVVEGSPLRVDFSFAGPQAPKKGK